MGLRPPGSGEVPSLASLPLTATMLLFHRNRIIKAVRTLNKGVIDLEANQTWKRARIHWVAVARYIGRTLLERRCSVRFSKPKTWGSGSPSQSDVGSSRQMSRPDIRKERLWPRRSLSLSWGSDLQSPSEERAAALGPPLRHRGFRGVRM